MKRTSIGFLILVSLMLLVTVATIHPITLLFGRWCDIPDVNLFNLGQLNCDLPFAAATYLVLPVAMVRCYMDRKRQMSMPDDEEPPAWWQE